MDLRLVIEAPDRLIVHLREGVDETTVAVSPADAGVASLTRALDDAVAQGYGECFWPGLPGRAGPVSSGAREATLDYTVMWTRGGASLWEHVFRATDAAEFVRDWLAAEQSRLSVR